MILLDKFKNHDYAADYGKVLAMTLATKKPAFLLLPRSLSATVTNRLWLDCAAIWHRSGGQSLVAAPPGALSADFARCGIPHTPLPVSSSLLEGWHKRRALTDIVHRARPGLIWLEELTDWRWLRQTAPVNAVIRCFAHDPLPVDARRQTLLADFLSRGGKLVATSRAVYHQLAKDFGLAEDDISLLLPAIDPNLYDPLQVKPDRALRLAAEWRIPENAALFLHCGALQPDGGQIAFFHAMAQSGRRDIYTVVLGEETAPGYRAKLMAALNHYGLSGQVLFTDQCADIPAALWLAQAVVCARRAPGGADPLLLAAQAMARPVLVSDAGAHLELVEPGYSAWVFPASDTDALHNAMLEILGLGEKARWTHGLRAREWVTEKFPYVPWRAAMLEEPDESAAAVVAA